MAPQTLTECRLWRLCVAELAHRQPAKQWHIGHHVEEAFVRIQFLEECGHEVVQFGPALNP